MIKKLQLGLYVVLAVSLFSCGGDRGNAGYTKVGECCYPADCISCCDPDGLVSVSRTTPAEAPLAREFKVTLTAKANADCTAVVVKEIIPDGLTYVASNPKAKQDGNELTWEINKMCCGESYCIDITYSACEEGCFKSCYSVSATPVCCQSIKVGCPELKICKTGTETTRIGCPVNYKIVVTNCGSSVARDVSLTDLVPPELQHYTCMDKLYWHLGDLQCGQSVCIPVCFTACKCGRAINTATVQACNCPPVTDTFTTMIEDCCIRLTKTGPEGPVTIGDNATYKITAFNEGNVDLTDVRIVDTIPSGTHFIEAKGAKINGNMATWSYPTFGPGETKDFEVTISSCVPGCLCNQVNVCCKQDCGDCAQACTQWVGVPNIWVGIQDKGPICVGACTEFSLCMKNQGWADDHNVKLRVEFPSELKVTGAKSPYSYKIDGNTVIFDTIPVFRAGEQLQFTIQAKGVEKGDARVKLRAMTDGLSKPYVKEESTIVY